MMMTLIASILSLAGCIALYLGRREAASAPAPKAVLKASAAAAFLIALFLFAGDFGSVKGTFVWLGAISLAGTVLVLIAGARRRPAG